MYICVYMFVYTMCLLVADSMVNKDEWCILQRLKKSLVKTAQNLLLFVVQFRCVYIYVATSSRR